MAVFRIAHISDLHLGVIADHLNPVESVESRSRIRKANAALRTLLKGAFRGGPNYALYPSSFSVDVALDLLQSLSAVLPTVDAVVATGDLATTGDDADLRLARDFFHGNLPSEWNPTGTPFRLIDDNAPVTLTLPGNHDRYEGIALLPASAQFEQHIGLHWDFDRGHAYSIEGVSPRVRTATFEMNGVALVVCLTDFSLEVQNSGEGGTGWIGQGRAGAPLVGHLIKATKVASGHVRGAGRRPVILWAVHFPPAFPGIDDDLRLLEESNLVAAAQACDVSAVLAGHTHHSLMYDAARSSATPAPPVHTICSGPSCGISAHGQYGYSVVEIDASTANVRVTPTHYVWDPAIRSFAAASSFPLG